MKKIYILMFVAFCLNTIQAQKTDLSKNFHLITKDIGLSSKKKNDHTFSKVNSGYIQGRYSPVQGLLDAYYSWDNNYSIYYNPVYIDSTPVIISNGISQPTSIYWNKLGISFDPQSLIFNSPYFNKPLFTASDSYVLDSLWLGGDYVRVTNSSIVDTLIIEIVWGDTSNSTVYGTNTFSICCTSNVSFPAPKFQFNTQQGNTCFLSAPNSNRRYIKYPLYESDSALLKPGKIALNIPLSQYGGVISLAGNEMVSTSISYKCGVPVNLGDTLISSDTSFISTHNFFGLMTAYADPNMYPNYFYDRGLGKCSSFILSSYNRYGLGVPSDPSYSTCITGTNSLFYIEFSIHGNSTVDNCHAFSSFSLQEDTVQLGNYNAYNYGYGSGSVSYHWDFGDGNTSNQAFPVHQYAVPGQYTICLTTYATDGTYTCSSTYCDSSVAHKIMTGHLMQTLTVIPSTTSISITNPVPEFKTYPNPIEDRFHVKISETYIDKYTQVTILDSYDHIVYNKVVLDTDFEIDSEGWAHGLYLIKIESMNGLIYRNKIIK